MVIAALSGLGGWSRWQFVGFFGIVEAAWGLASIHGPNIWRLPVAQVSTPRGTPVKLAASTLLVPHWAAVGRVAGGLTLVVIAVWQEGLAAGVVFLPLASVLLAGTILALSALTARLGALRPDIDVLQLVVRWRSRESEVPAFSLGASVLQVALSILTIPAIKLMEPSALYAGGLGLRVEALLATAVFTAALLGVAAFAWRGHIAWSAPLEQEVEAEQNA
jgi:hypothetical protein